MTTDQREVTIARGLNDALVEDALRVSYDAFSKKFRIGFRDADDFVRLFVDSVDTTICLSATAGGRLMGILTFQTKGREFYHLKPMAVFTRFSPPRAVRVMFNLLLLGLDDGVGDDEFVVDSLAVDRSARGMGVGTELMRNAEEMALSMRKRMMSLSVIGDNEGAIRLYERLGYEKTRTWRGFFVKLASGSIEVHRMEKRLARDA